MDNLTQILEDIYKPTVPERKLKAKFWVAWNDGPSKGTPTAESILEVLSESSVRKKVENGAFVAWFLNSFEAAEQLHYLLQTSMAYLEEVLTSPEEKTSDRLKAVDKVLDLSKVTGVSKAPERFKDEEIEGMSDEEVDQLIANYAD